MLLRSCYLVCTSQYTKLHLFAFRFIICFLLHFIQDLRSWKNDFYSQVPYSCRKPKVYSLIYWFLADKNYGFTTNLFSLWNPCKYCNLSSRMWTRRSFLPPSSLLVPAFSQKEYIAFCCLSYCWGWGDFP